MHMIDTREGKLYLADGTVCRLPERLLREPSPNLLAEAIERWARRLGLVAPSDQVAWTW